MDDPCLPVEHPAIAAAAATAAHTTPIARRSLRTPLGYSGARDARPGRASRAGRAPGRADALVSR
jgi:hypothetical protein